MATTALKQLTKISKRRGIWAQIVPANKIKTGYGAINRHVARAY